MSMENINKPSGRQPKPSAEETAKWNKRLAEEGMPDEIIEQKETVHTAAYKTALNDAYLYFLHTPHNQNYGAHRTKFQEFMTQLRSGGANEDELLEFSDDDSMRAIEDRATDLIRSAQQAAREAARQNPRLINRPEAIVRIIISKLVSEEPDIPTETLRAFAASAAETIMDRQ